MEYRPDRVGIMRILYLVPAQILPHNNYLDIFDINDIHVWGLLFTQH